MIIASVTLAVLIFLMTGTTGLFTKKLNLLTYVDNAGGLRSGAPVRLQGVDIGNVIDIRVVPGHGNTPVQITMRISTKNNYNQFVKKDTSVVLSTAGVLGETFVDLDSTNSKQAQAVDGDILPARDVPDIQDVVRASQSTLQNVNTLLVRADRIMGAVENAQGSIGKLIYDKQLYENMNSSVRQVRTILDDINNGRGSIGKLLKDEAMYAKLNESVDRLNSVANKIDRGEGSIGKFINDPSLYNNANQTIAKANQLMDAVNRGEGTLGKFAKDPEFARKMDEMITNLNSISRGLAQGEGSAGKLLKDPSMYTNADQMLVETRGLVKAIRENPKRYLTIHFRIF